MPVFISLLYIKMEYYLVPYYFIFFVNFSYNCSIFWSNYCTAFERVLCVAPLNYKQFFPINNKSSLTSEIFLYSEALKLSFFKLLIYGIKNKL